MNPYTERETRRPRKDPPSENARKRAREAAERSRKVAGLLERAFHLMVEDDPVHPATEYVYAALCQAETRAAMEEGWYGRTYPEDRT